METDEYRPLVEAGAERAADEVFGGELNRFALDDLVTEGAAEGVDFPSGGRGGDEVVEDLGGLSTVGGLGVERELDHVSASGARDSFGGLDDGDGIVTGGEVVGFRSVVGRGVFHGDEREGWETEG